VGPSSSCKHATPPPPPAITNAGGDLDIVVAPYSIALGDGNDALLHPLWKSIGYDLDHTCTGEGVEGPSCVVPSWAVQVADGFDGRDNALGSFVNYLAAASPGSGTEDELLRMKTGRGIQLVRIRNYNGQADDDQVEVDVYVSYGLTDAPPPKNDGTDRWVVASDWLRAGADGQPNIDLPKYFDDKAYVTNGMMVSHFDTWVVGDPSRSWQRLTTFG